MKAVKLSHIGGLDSFEISRVQSILNKALRRISRDFKNAELLVDIKKHEKIGKPYYGIRMRVDAPTTKLAAKQADWDLYKAIHKTLDNIENQIKKKYEKDISKELKKNRE